MCVQLLLFGGHGTGGWLSRYDVYHNDCIVLDRVSVQWKRLPTSNDSPSARAYHSMTCIGSRYLLFGGFDGKSTFGELWWLVSADDPIAKRSSAPASNNLSERNIVTGPTDLLQSEVGETHKEESPISELQKRLDVSVSPTSDIHVDDELVDKELLELSSRLTNERVNHIEQDTGIQVIDLRILASILQGLYSTSSHYGARDVVQVVRDHWMKSTPVSLPLRELGPLFRDYKRLIIHNELGGNGVSGPAGQQTYRFYHMRTASQLCMADVPCLLTEYKQLISN
ncbi:hypothetical protein IFM89_013603 [Coptis chinensis]|uniref:Uncharacterized protein n=1 Tax=Coptis chinensis TaxID=261450 RepID=A0A835HED6_9MAGN|nr:hypothetical protein IFM89_013603 [Coptis chinensis]